MACVSVAGSCGCGSYVSVLVGTTSSELTCMHARTFRTPACTCLHPCRRGMLPHRLTACARAVLVPQDASGWRKASSATTLRRYNAPDDVQRKLGRRVCAIRVRSGTLGDALQAQCGSLCASRVT